MKVWSLVVLVLFLAAIVYGIEILENSFGTRPMSLGGAYVAVGGDPEAVLWNPGGIPSVDYGILSLGYQSRFSDINYMEVFSAFKLPQNFLNLGGIWGLGFVYWGTETEGWSSINESAGSVSAYEYLIGLGYKREFSKVLSGGVSLKYAQRSIDGEIDTSMVLDVGAVSTIEGIGIGLLVKNIGIGSESSEIPMGMSLGGYYTFFSTHDKQHQIAGMVQLDSVQNVGFNLKLGSEYSWYGGKVWDGIVKVRVGYDTSRAENSLGLLSGFSFGLGVNYFGFTLDYTLIESGDLGMSHEIALTYNFDNIFKRKSIAGDLIKPEIKLDVNSKLITPDDDGQDESIIFNVVIADNVAVKKWEWEIYDSAGRLVKNDSITLIKDEKRVAKEIVWDGKDNKGKVVYDNIYEFHVRAMDKAGNVSESVIYGIIVTTDPYAVLLKADKQIINFVGDKVVFNLIRVPKSKIKRYNLKIEDVDGNVVREIKEPKPTKRRRRRRSKKKKYVEFKDVIWDGKDDTGVMLPNGNYTLTLEVEYEGGVRKVSYPITVMINIAGASATKNNAKVDSVDSIEDTNATKDNILLDNVNNTEKELKKNKKGVVGGK